MTQVPFRWASRMVGFWWMGSIEETGDTCENGCEETHPATGRLKDLEKPSGGSLRLCHTSRSLHLHNWSQVPYLSSSICCKLDSRSWIWALISSSSRHEFPSGSQYLFAQISVQNTSKDCFLSEALTSQWSGPLGPLFLPCNLRQRPEVFFRTSVR